MPEEMPNKEAIESYEKIAEENQQELQEIEENKLPPIIPKKVKDKLVKVIRGVLAGGMVGSVGSLAACKEPSAVVEEQQQEEEKPAAEVSNETKEETQNETPPTVDETPIESALETTLKEKVSFISEVLPGAELNTKTGELTAKAGNEWGVKEGENIGWYVVGAYKEKNSDGLETEKDAIGLIPLIIEFMQNKIFEEKEERPLPIPINLKETKDVKITELKINSGGLSGVSSFGMNFPIGTIICSPWSGEYGLAPLILSTKTKTEDKSIGWYYYNEDDFKKGNLKYSGQFFIDFAGGSVIPKPTETEKISVEDREAEVSYYEVKLGDPLIEITESSFLDETTNKINDVWFFYENPGNYQLNLLHFKSIFKDGQITSEATVDFLNLKRNQESESIKVFILPNEPAHEQTN